MKNSDIETMGKLALALIKYLPESEYALLKEYLGVYERLKAKNDSQKQRYQDKAEYHRETTRQWRQDNKERNRAYQREYAKKKKLQSENPQ